MLVIDMFSISNKLYLHLLINTLPEMNSKLIRVAEGCI